MKILCFGAHPDDLEIGMGGTISKLIKQGHEVHMFISRECEEIRLEEQMESKEILKPFRLYTNNETPFTFYDEKRMEEVGVVTRLIREIKPDRVYMPCIYDSNQHHEALGKIILTSLRLSDISCYMYSMTTVKGYTIEKFIPQVYEDITNEFITKIEAIGCHRSQIKKWPDYFKYIKDKDAHNGFEVGVKYAETFYVVREVRK
jgi:LmbE family N-acetylglucosaminyl deacetylase